MNNLKKVISTAAAVAMLASSASAFAASFPDVDKSANYAGAVDTLTALNIVNGDDAGKFNPDNTVTRAEFAKMVVEALGEGDAAASSTYTSFADSQGHWAAGYIEAGVGKGFINGYDENTFGPDDTVTYAQAVKMLVGAIGYDTYATQQGGWPSGYLAYGSSLDIINGVTGVTNDTALTRAQCAVLVNNALKAPLCVVGLYLPGGLTHTVLSPVLTVKDGYGEDWQTLLTEKHNAYVAKGRVFEIPKQNLGLDLGEVRFRVEVARNFDELYYNVNDETGNYENYGWTSIRAFAGETAAEDMLYQYAEAVVQKDVDSDDYTIISIAPYGTQRMVEIAAKDVKGLNDAETRLEAYKSETSNNTVKYQIDNENGVTTFVNGIEVEGEALADIVVDYITGEQDADDNWIVAPNKVGTVTLIDEAGLGQTTTNGYYNLMFITKYDTLIVDTVQTTSALARIYDKGANGKMEWDPEDDKVEVTFTLDGEEIAYTDLQENDVLTVAYDMVNYENLKGCNFYEVQVSRTTAAGVVTGYNTRNGENKITVDGTDYDVIAADEVSSDMLNTEYTLYLDVFGNVAYLEEGNSQKNYGVVVGMYTKAGDDYPTVRIITADGEIKTYEAKNDDVAEAIAEAVGQSSTEFGKADVDFANSVIEYKITNNRITFKDDKDLTEVAALAPAGSDGDMIEFNANTSRLGSCTVNAEVTKLIDLENYVEYGEVNVVAVDSLVDETEYEAYLYDRNNNGDYRFGIILEGTNSLNSASELAVVAGIEGVTDVDGVDCTIVKVVEGGVEDVEILIEGDAEVVEGEVIAYIVNSNGYVSNDKYVSLFTPEEDYEDMLDAAIADFSDNITNAIYNSDEEAYEVAINGETSESKDIFVAFGPVYKKSGNSIDLFQAGGATSNFITETENYNVANANSVVYDYSAKAGYRVSVGSVNQSKGSYSIAIDEDADEDSVIWADVVANEVEPVMAFIKTVDNNTTDVVYYTAG